MVNVGFKGKLVFPDKDTLERALGQVSEILHGEAPSLANEWKKAHKIQDNVISIQLDVGCSNDDFWTFEGIVESLAGLASSGVIEGTRDDYPQGEVELYEANSD